MRYLMPIMVGLLILGCSKPKVVSKHPKIPYMEEGPAPGPLSDGSLWQDRLVIADNHAYRLNDLVTIHIKEDTNAKSMANVNTAKDGNSSLDAPSLFAKLEKAGVSSGKEPKTATTNSKYKGSGTTTRSATFTTTITARVVKVLGNGNLIFEGLRDIQLNNETQRLFIAGMVDPTKLDPMNGISSDGVAELRIGYGGQGIVEETLRPGYISRLLNYIWPF